MFLWLSTLGLQGYTNTFETNGFDDVKFMVREERREGEGKGWEGEGKGWGGGEGTGERREEERRKIGYCYLLGWWPVGY